MSKTVTDEIGEQLDRQLLDILTHGAIVIGSDGLPVTGPDGRPMRKPPSAAVLGQARQRVKDRRVEKKADGPNPVADLLQKAADSEKWDDET